MIDDLSIAVHAFGRRILTSLSVNEILLSMCVCVCVCVFPQTDQIVFAIFFSYCHHFALKGISFKSSTFKHLTQI